MSPLWSLGEAWSRGGEESLINYLLSSEGSLTPIVVESAPADKGTQSREWIPGLLAGWRVSFGPSLQSQTPTD
jgi:hypothetical protein